MDDAVSSLADPRLIRILDARGFASDQLTLEQLGDVFGITRERVRQLEKRARPALVEAIAQRDSRGLVAAALHGLPGAVVALDDLLALRPALTEVVPAAQQPAWRVLACVDESVEVADGWLTRPSLIAARAATIAALHACAGAHGETRLDHGSLSGIVAQRENGSAQAVLESWVRHCGVPVLDGHALTKSRSMLDLAAAILAIAGEALSPGEIIERLPHERSERSLRNGLYLDDRFDRVDRDRWALREWGMEVYSGIREEIAERIDRDGGQTPIAELIEELTEAFSVSATSVRAYASAAPFQCVDQMVSRATAPTITTRPPESTARLFRRRDGWAYRVRVTSDHLRGSASPAPLAIGTVLGMRSGESAVLDSPLGEQTVYWTGIQITFGTIRRHLQHHGVQEGDEVFLEIGDDRGFSLAPMRPATGDSLREALRRVDAPEATDPAEAWTAFAEAVRLPPDASAERIVAAYSDRGDADVAALLLLADAPPARAPMAPDRPPTDATSGEAQAGSAAVRGEAAEHAAPA